MRCKLWAGYSVAGGLLVLLGGSCSSAEHTFGDSTPAGDGPGGEPSVTTDAGSKGDGTSGAGTAGSAPGGGNGGSSAGSAGTAGNALGGEGGQANDCPFQSCDCREGETQACGPLKAVGVCKPGSQTCVQGGWGECVGAVLAQGRDCTSANDNDCDGKPDNTIDDACKCVPGNKEACGEHPGNDGKGPCKAGERVCMGSGNSGVWGPCNGSVAPQATDSCSVKGDDSNCDGQKNGGCACLSGDKSNCLDVYGSKGVCSTIALTCTDAGKWPSSVGCAAAGAETCAADNKDENCDGSVDEGCSCVNGTMTVCGDCGEGMQTCTAGKYGTCTKTTPSLKGPKLLCIKGATFDMGNAANGYEKPVHPVTLPSFWMDETEVTAAQYQECKNAGNCTVPPSNEPMCDYGVSGRGNWPMNCLDQLQAKAFCQWAGKRLPIEEEWEYAARGTDGRKYPWGNTWDPAKANHSDTSTGPVNVASYPAGKSPFGLFDMVGNVQEWTASYPCQYVSSPGTTPCAVNTSVIHRGGSYYDSTGVEDNTVTWRTSDDASGTNYARFGFRCAKDK